MAGLLTLPFFDVGAGITPADGALLYFNVVGSETDKDTYTTAAATTPHANPVVADSKGVFPAIYLVGDYDWVLTDKNSVQQNTGSVSELVTGSGQLVNVLARDTLNDAVIDTSLQAGLAINIAERTTGNGGGAMWDVVLSSTVTENTYNIVQCTGVATLSLVLRLDGSIKLDEWGAVDGGDISTVLQFALDYLATEIVFGRVRGTVILPSNWDVTLSASINIQAGCTFLFWGSTITQTTTGLVTFSVNSAFAPVGVRIEGSALYGPDTTTLSRASSGSYGIKVTGGLPFTQINIEELKNFEYGGYMKDSFSSSIRFGRIHLNRVNFQTQDACHATEIHCNMNESADDDGLRINDINAVTFTHNITFHGAYQKSRYGIIAGKCYEVWGENIYCEANTEADYHIGYDDGGVGAFQAFNCGAHVMQSASPTGTGATQGNLVFRGAIGCTIENYSNLGGATGNNINYDGNCGDLAVSVKIGNEPLIYKVSGSATDDKLRITYKGEERISGGNQITYSSSTTATNKGTTFATNISGRETLVEQYDGGAASDYKNIAVTRQIFSDDADVFGLTVDHSVPSVTIGHDGTFGYALFVHSDNGSKWRLNVDNSGTLTVIGPV